MSPEFSEEEGLPLIDAFDAAIIMHRDVHFGGKFEIMLEYYARGGKGVHPDFEIKRIQELALMEKRMNANLAGIVLSGPDAERVAKAREAYKKLRQLYEVEKPLSKHPVLIADLILTEDEEAVNEIKAVIKEGGYIVRALIDLIRDEDFYDTLFPGFGLAPALAIKCLGRIGDKRAIIALFEAIGSGDFFDDDIILEALHSIGEPAKEFLLKVIQGKPLNEDNERAAIALIAFKGDAVVAERCFEMLQDPIFQKDPILATYLVLACEWLTDEKKRKQFRELIKNPKLPKLLINDMKAVLKAWDKN